MKASHISFERTVELLPFSTRQQAFRDTEGWVIEVDGDSVSLSKSTTHIIVVGVPFVFVPAPASPAPLAALTPEAIRAIARAPQHVSYEPPETQQKHKRRR